MSALEPLTDNQHVSDTMLLAVKSLDIEAQVTLVHSNLDVDHKLYEVQQVLRKMAHWPEIECRCCRRTFYPKDSRSRYCCDRCRTGVDKLRRKATREAMRKNKSCLYCKKTFSAKRGDAKYCCLSHRVRACQVRKKKA